MKKTPTAYRPVPLRSFKLENANSYSLHYSAASIRSLLPPIRTPMFHLSQTHPNLQTLRSLALLLQLWGRDSGLRTLGGPWFWRWLQMGQLRVWCCAQVRSLKLCLSSYKDMVLRRKRESGVEDRDWDRRNTKCFLCCYIIYYHRQAMTREPPDSLRGRMGQKHSLHSWVDDSLQSNPE